MYWGLMQYDRLFLECIYWRFANIRELRHELGDINKETLRISFFPLTDESLTVKDTFSFGHPMKATTH